VGRARSQHSLDCPPQYQTSPKVAFTIVAVTCSVAHVAVAAMVKLPPAGAAASSAFHRPPCTTAATVYAAPPAAWSVTVTLTLVAAPVTTPYTAARAGACCSTMPSPSVLLKAMA
jgi:hypothetical protein